MPIGICPLLAAASLVVANRLLEEPIPTANLPLYRISPPVSVVLSEPDVNCNDALLVVPARRVR